MRKFTLFLGLPALLLFVSMASAEAPRTENATPTDDETEYVAARGFRGIRGVGAFRGVPFRGIRGGFVPGFRGIGAFRGGYGGALAFRAGFGGYGGLGLGYGGASLGYGVDPFAFGAYGAGGCGAGLPPVGGSSLSIRIRSGFGY